MDKESLEDQISEIIKTDFKFAYFRIHENFSLYNVKNTRGCIEKSRNVGWVKVRAVHGGNQSLQRN